MPSRELLLLSHPPGADIAPPHEGDSAKRTVRFGFLVGMIVALLAVLANGVLSVRNILVLVENDTWVAHTQEVLANLERIPPPVLDAEIALREHILTQGKANGVLAHAEALRRSSDEFEGLLELTRDDPRQQDRIREVRRRIGSHLGTLDESDPTRRDAIFLSALERSRLDPGRDATARIRQSLEEIANEEKRLLELRAEESRQSARIALFSVAVAVASLIGGLGLVGWLAVRESRRQRRAAQVLHLKAVELDDAVRARESARTLLETLMKTAPVGLAYVDLDYRFVHVNDFMSAVSGIPVEEYLGKRVVEVVPEIWPRVEPIYRRVLETGEPVTGIELSATAPSTGDLLRHWMFSYYPVKENRSKVVGFGVVLVELTERKKAAEALRVSEERFRQLADAMPQIVWASRPDGYLDYFNKRWYEFTGSPEGGGDESWMPILHPDDVQLCLDTWYESVRTGQPYQIEYRFKDRHTGQYRWHLGRALPVRDPDGQIIRWYGTCTDIDLQKRAIVELGIVRHELEDRVVERTTELTAANENLRDEVEQRHRVEQRLLLQYTTAQILARSTCVDEAMGEVLKAVREHMGWDVAEFWHYDPDAGGVPCFEISTGPIPSLEEFASASRSFIFPPPGVGLSGLVWATGRSAWFEDLATQKHFSRAAIAQAAGLTSGLGFPVLSGDSVVGVLQFFGRAVPRPDGETVALLTGIAGQIGQFIERKRAEAALKVATNRLQSILDSATEMAIIAGTPEGIITAFNVGAERMLGYSSAEMVGKQTPALFHCPDEVRKRGEELSIEMGVPVSGFETFVVHARRGRPQQSEWTYIRKDGTRLTVSLVVTAKRDSTGKVFGFLGIARDISELKRTENALAQAKDAAEAANRAKSEFLANMSHEIRTPLNGILGMAGLVLDTELTSTQTDYLQALHRSATGLLTLINDILDFSKIEAGKLDVFPEPFALRDGLDDALKPLTIAAQQKGLAIACRIDPAVPDAVIGDLGRLRQVVINLVGNAIKFTHHGEILIEVGVDEATRDEILLRFAVRDTGIGIAREKLDTIFNPFEQADGSTTRKYGGTGLGLTISTRIVHLLGGTIRVESEPGRGSTFWFTTRMALREIVAGGGVPPPTPIVGPTPAPPASGLRILLAEDNKVNQMFMVKTLQKEGHQVVVAGTGREALAALERGAFDLVLMDVAMPEMDGLEATRLLRDGERGTERHVPVIALTAHAMKGDREACFAAGMDGYVCKPFQIDDLRNAIRTANRKAPTRPALPRDAIPVFDQAGLLSRLEGNRVLLRNLVELFRVEGPRQLANVRLALDLEDAVGVQRAAHTLKGAVALLGGPKAADAAGHLETMGKRGDLEDAERAFTRLEVAVHDLGSALSSLEGAGPIPTL